MWEHVLPADYEYYQILQRFKIKAKILKCQHINVSITPKLQNGYM